MTNKQIIIHGVNVSGCSYGEIEKSIFKCSCKFNVCSALMFCKDNPNCYYKQLKRKEQEYEELRGVIRKDICSHYVLGECSQKHHNNCVGRNQCIKDLEQECEELKKWLPIVARLEEQFKSHEKAKGIDYKIYVEQVFTELDQLKAENEELKKVSCKFKNYCTCDTEKLFQTLTEIKKIAEIKYPKSLFNETFVEVINHCPYFDCGNCKCLENKEKQSCGGFICSRKQSVYYQEKTTYFEQILQKISEIDVELKK